jgi:hypothetical protein
MNTISVKAQSATLAPTYPPRRRLRPVSNTQPVIVKAKDSAIDLTKKVARNSILIMVSFIIINLVLSSLMNHSIYKISSLKSELLASSIEIQVVEEELAGMGSPSFIEAKAKAMGMVKNYNFKWISLKDYNKYD